MSLEIAQIPALNDNYIYLLHEPTSGTVAVIDPSEAQPVEDELKQRDWQLSMILNTHHHYDHTGGNLALQKAYGCDVYGYGDDAERIDGITHTLANGDTMLVGEAQAQVLFIPGHTRGHIAFYFAQDKALFCGDTLFSMGCGRLFEGTPAQMHASLSILAQLPTDTRVFCAHEYTEANGRFALTLEPHNSDLRQRMTEVQALRAHGQSTIPSTMQQERATNPFLRADSEEIRKTLAMDEASTLEVFSEIRRRKDHF